MGYSAGAEVSERVSRGRLLGKEIMLQRILAGMSFFSAGFNHLPCRGMGGSGRSLEEDGWIWENHGGRWVEIRAQSRVESPTGAAGRVKRGVLEKGGVAQQVQYTHWMLQLILWEEGELYSRCSTLTGCFRRYCGRRGELYSRCSTHALDASGGTVPPPSAEPVRWSQSGAGAHRPAAAPDGCAPTTPHASQRPRAFPRPAAPPGCCGGRPPGAARLPPQPSLACHPALQGGGIWRGGEERGWGGEKGGRRGGGGGEGGARL